MISNQNAGILSLRLRESIAAEVHQLFFPSAFAGSTPIPPWNLRTWLPRLSPSGAHDFFPNVIINDQSSMAIDGHQ